MLINSNIKNLDIAKNTKVGLYFYYTIANMWLICKIW